MNFKKHSINARYQPVILYIILCQVLTTKLDAAINDFIYTTGPSFSELAGTSSEETTFMFSTTPVPEDLIIVWNKSVSASEYHLTYCSMLCVGNTFFYLPRTELCPSIECFRCDCNKPLCEFYGTCCPDYHESLPVNISLYTDVIRWEDISKCLVDLDTTGVVLHNAANSLDVSFICELNGETAYLFIRSCPTNYHIGSRERTRCENDVPAADQDFETLLPVTDVTTGYIYYNKYCANCNGVYTFQSWNMTSKCFSYINVYKAITPEEFLKLALLPGSDCYVYKDPPSNTSPSTCRRSWFKTAVSSCNVTGQWDVYDEDVLRACENTSQVASRTRYKEIVYKNLFCAMCNMKISSNAMVNCTPCTTGKGAGSTLPFSFLLNLNSDSDQNIDDCPEKTVWAGPDKICLPLLCSPGKVLMNGTCVTANQQVKGLLYQLHVFYIPRDIIEANNRPYVVTSTASYLNRFRSLIKYLVSRISDTYGIKVSVLNANDANEWSSDKCTAVNSSILMPTPCDFQLPWISLEVVLQGSDLFSRDEFEFYFLNPLIKVSISLGDSDFDYITLKPLLLPDRVNSLLDCSTDYGEKLSCLNDSVSESSDNLLIYNKDDFFEIEPQLNCAFIRLNSSDYTYKNDSTTVGRILLYLNNKEITISELDELRLVSIERDGTLKICQELWDSNIKSHIQPSNNKSEWMVLSQYILTWICLLLSITCLALTVLTYFLFPVLRSVAGKNNIFLSLTLLLAQMFLLAAFHVKQTGHLCTLLAITTHFLWLSMFCWCFTTCFHMFRVFSAQTRTTHATATSERLHLVKNVAGCSVIPALIVIGVIVTNYFTTEGRLIGYGKDKCFLDSTPLVAITLVTPLSFILLCNIFFFSVTIIKIHNVRKMQTQDFKQDDRANLYIYIKLSSMTGMFWILNIIAEATDNDPLRFIAIFLNGLQGVFIFLSYICNRRVLKLYARALGFVELGLNTSTSDRSTVAKEL